MSRPTFERSGVYRTPGDIARARKELGAPEMTWVSVDLGPVRSKSELMQVLAGALSLPRDFGANWDALADSLQSPPSRVLHLRNADRARDAIGNDWPVFLGILRESAKYWKTRRTPFVVLADGVEELPEWR